MPLSTTSTLLRRYRTLADRYLHLVAKDSGMHPTDTSALSHLLELQRQGRVPTAGELGELLSLSGPATTAAIDRLENRGLVVRRSSAQDGRRVEVHLSADVDTAQGRTIFADMSQALDRALKRHSKADAAAFHRVLSDVCDEIAAANDARLQRR